jgi:hypothetical protein
MQQVVRRATDFQTQQRRHPLQQTRAAAALVETVLQQELLVATAVMVEVVSLLFVTQHQHHVHQRRLGSVPMLL